MKVSFLWPLLILSSILLSCSKGTSTSEETSSTSNVEKEILWDNNGNFTQQPSNAIMSQLNNLSCNQQVIDELVLLYKARVALVNGNGGSGNLNQNQLLQACGEINKILNFLTNDCGFNDPINQLGLPPVPAQCLGLNNGGGPAVNPPPGGGNGTGTGNGGGLTNNNAPVECSVAVQVPDLAAANVNNGAFTKQCTKIIRASEMIAQHLQLLPAGYIPVGVKICSAPDPDLNNIEILVTQIANFLANAQNPNQFLPFLSQDHLGCLKECHTKAEAFFVQNPGLCTL